MLCTTIINYTCSYFLVEGLRRAYALAIDRVRRYGQLGRFHIGGGE